MRRRRADGLFDEIATFGALCAASSRAALGKRRGPSGTGGSRLAGSRSRGPDRPPGARNRNTAGNRNNNQGFRVSSTPQKPEPARSRPRRASVGASRAGHDEPAPLVERGGVTAGAVLGPRGRRASGRPFLRAAALLTASGSFAFSNRPITPFMGYAPAPPWILHFGQSSTNISKDMCARNRPNFNTESGLTPNGGGAGGVSPGSAPKGNVPRSPRASRPAIRGVFAPGTPASAAAAPGGSGGQAADVD